MIIKQGTNGRQTTKLNDFTVCLSLNALFSGFVKKPKKQPCVSVVSSDFEGNTPNFTLKPLDTSAMIGSKAILFCGAFGLGSDLSKPTITWLKDEKEIDL